MTIRFRTGTALGSAPTQVDRSAGIIRGVSVIEMGEAKGHGVWVDATMLDQVVAAGNASPSGIKARFTHPGMCADGLGTLIGHHTSFRRDGDRVLADLHLSETAKATPNGDLHTYVLDLAEKEPSRFGESIVFTGTPVWKTQRGEIAVNDQSLSTRTGYRKPDDLTDEKPYARVARLLASDLVDEPAANTKGLFGFSAASFFAGTGGDLPEQAFAILDQLRDEHGITFEAAHGLLARYAAARGITPPPTITPPSDPMKLSATILSLSTAHPEHAGLILSMLGADKPEADIVTAVSDARFAAITAERDALKTKLATAEKAATDASAERDALKTKVERFASIERTNSRTLDPGTEQKATGSAQTQQDVEQAWANPKVKALHFNDRTEFDLAVSTIGLPAVIAAATKADPQ